MGEIARKKLAAIEDIGEESIFDDIASVSYTHLTLPTIYSV